MITIKEGNLFDATEGVICHQVNCMGVMGAGIAAQFKERFPENYAYYKEICHRTTNPMGLLGKLVIMGDGFNGLYSCSMFAQYKYGHDKSFIYTDYDAFKQCCYGIRNFIKYDSTLTVHMPYGIGCGLANGDWHIIYKIIEEVFEDFNVIIWKLKEN